MRKNRVRLTESGLRRIVNKSVRNTLNEASFVSKNDSVNYILSSILRELEDITNSGYIPFASPSPSSTEQKVKDYIYQAMSCIEAAIKYDRQLYNRW